MCGDEGQQAPGPPEEPHEQGCPHRDAHRPDSVVQVIRDLEQHRDAEDLRQGPAGAGEHGDDEPEDDGLLHHPGLDGARSPEHEVGGLVRAERQPPVGGCGGEDESHADGDHRQRAEADLRPHLDPALLVPPEGEPEVST